MAESRQREEWRRTATLGTALLNAWGAKVKFTDLFPFADDAPEIKPPKVGIEVLKMFVPGAS